MEDCSCKTLSLDPSLLSPSDLLCKSLSLIPISHYFLALLLTLLSFLYSFLEIHFFHDLLTRFRGNPVSITFNSSSQLYQSIASKCSVLNGRFCPTPWLSSPHLQTAFLIFFESLLMLPIEDICSRPVMEEPLLWIGYSVLMNDAVLRDDKTPIVTLVPGLTSDSASAYIKHLAFTMARLGWNVVVSNHRGLGGIPITSDCFYNGGWTEDLRSIIDHINCQYPEAPLYAVGTSLGANILVKYVGEQGVDIPLTGATAVCSPWDLLICDRFINRRLVQKLYGRVLAVGLKGYAQLHHSIMTRLVDWDSVKLTVDAYYRCSSCVNFVGNVSVPLLCVSALDDPVCSREAITWDECRANENIIPATIEHGGHLAYYEGITANGIWWVRAVGEFFQVLHSSPLRNKRKKMEESNLHTLLKSSIDHGPYVNVREDWMVTATKNAQGNVSADIAFSEHVGDVKEDAKTISAGERNDNTTDKTDSRIEDDIAAKKTDSRIDLKLPVDLNVHDLTLTVRRYMGQLSRHSKISIWLLAYIAIITTWPLVGSALLLFIKKRFKSIIPVTFIRRLAYTTVT